MIRFIDNTLYMKITLTISILILSVILQTTLFSFLDIYGVIPNLVLILSLFLTVWKKFEKVWWIILLIGLLTDLLIGLQAAEVLILNDYEMGILERKTGLTEKEIIKYVDTCVVTLGSKGSIIYSKKSQHKNSQKVEAAKVKDAVDPTGAGDAFRAGFLYGYIKDWDLEKCAKLGSVVAAFAVEKHGTQEHKFSLENIKKRYLENYQEKFEI